MNRRTVILALGAGAVFLAGIVAQPGFGKLLGRLRTVALTTRRSADENPYDPSHYARQTRYYDAMGQTHPIVFLGDSRIEWGAWTEMLGRADISNRGIAGDTTRGILDRLQTSVPDAGVVCVIQAGVNDLSKGVPVEAVLTNFRSIFDHLLKEKRARVIVTSVILVRRDMAELNRAIVECNRGLSELVASVGADWLDLNTALSPLGYLSAEFSEDGVHLNKRGYEQICRDLAPHLPAAATS